MRLGVTLLYAFLYISFPILILGVVVALTLRDVKCERIRDGDFPSPSNTFLAKEETLACDGPLAVNASVVQSVSLLDRNRPGDSNVVFRDNERGTMVSWSDDTHLNITLDRVSDIQVSKRSFGPVIIEYHVTDFLLSTNYLRLLDEEEAKVSSLLKEKHLSPGDAATNRRLIDDDRRGYEVFRRWMSLNVQDPT